jgi:hypothetical protein
VNGIDGDGRLKPGNLYLLLQSARPQDTAGAEGGRDNAKVLERFLRMAIRLFSYCISVLAVILGERHLRPCHRACGRRAGLQAQEFGDVNINAQFARVGAQIIVDFRAFPANRDFRMTSAIGLLATHVRFATYFAEEDREPSQSTAISNSNFRGSGEA